MGALPQTLPASQGLSGRLTVYLSGRGERCNVLSLFPRPLLHLLCVVCMEIVSVRMRVCVLICTQYRPLHHHHHHHHQPSILGSIERDVVVRSSRVSIRETAIVPRPCRVAKVRTLDGERGASPWRLSPVGWDGTLFDSAFGSARREGTLAMKSCFYSRSFQCVPRCWKAKRTEMEGRSSRLGGGWGRPFSLLRPSYPLNSARFEIQTDGAAHYEASSLSPSPPPLTCTILFRPSSLEPSRALLCVARFCWGCEKHVQGPCLAGVCSNKAKTIYASRVGRKEGFGGCQKSRALLIKADRRNLGIFGRLG